MSCVQVANAYNLQGFAYEFPGFGVMDGQFVYEVIGIYKGHLPDPMTS